MKDRCRSGRTVRAAAVLVGLVSTLPASGAEAAVARWTTHGPPGPVMASMALDPANPSTVYAGTSANGVFKTTSGGARWFAVSRGLPPTAHVYDLVIDPTRHDTLWAALGEAVFTSEDGGHSWREADSGIDHPLIVTLAVDPVDPDTVFAGGTGGLIGKVVYRTTDGGETWRNISGSITSGSVEALAIDPSEHRTIYAGAGVGRVLYKSTDGGRTWGPGTTACRGRRPSTPWPSIPPIPDSSTRGPSPGMGSFEQWMVDEPGRRPTAEPNEPSTP